MSMQPPGSGDPNPNRSMFAQLLMNLFNQGQPFGGAGAGASPGAPNQFPAAPGSGLQGLFPATPSGPPTDMSVMGPWGAGIDPTQTGGGAPAQPPPIPQSQLNPPKPQQPPPISEEQLRFPNGVPAAGTPFPPPPSTFPARPETRGKNKPVVKKTFPARPERHSPNDRPRGK